MRASNELATLQRKFPPWTEDRCAPLLMQVAHELSRELSVLSEKKLLVMGEIGWSAPNASTRHFDDGSHLVVVNSGLLDFAFAVAQTLHGAARIVKDGGKEIAPTENLRAIAPRIAALYEGWKSGALWIGERLQPLNQPLPDAAAERADQLARAAIIFILTHELAHVLEYKPEKDDLSETEQVSPILQEELWADSAAIRTILQYSQHRGRGGSIRTDLAGAIVALRILSGLEKLGHHFPGHYPPPEQRLITLWSAIRELIETEETEAAYWYKTTMAYAFDELMETAENLALLQGPTAALTPERIFSRICSALEEVVHERLSLERALQVINFDLNRASTAILRDVASTAKRVLRPLRPPFIAIGSVAVQHKIAMLFMELLPKFPARARILFKRSRRKEKR